MIETKQIHVISFDVPFPPNYGGIIDVFAKLKALKNEGFFVILHAFLYNKPLSEPEEKVYDELFVYKRQTSILSQFSSLPYIVKSRINHELVENINKKPGAVLIEGLHNCWLLNEKSLENRFKIVRLHNIEHEYYDSLAKSTSSFFKKLFFTIESKKLKKYESILNKADLLLPISETDETYFKNQFPNKKCNFLPAFHLNDKIEIKTGKGNYALYQANLSVPENEKTILELVESWKNFDYKLIIAGKDPSDRILQKIKGAKNITLFANTDRDTLKMLLQQAHINIVWSESVSGSKLRLFDALYLSRYVFVHQSFKQNFTSNGIVSFASKAELLTECKNVFTKEFSKTELAERQKLLSNFASNKESIKTITNSIPN